MTEAVLGDRYGPVTEYQAAAADYGDRFGWPCHAHDQAVWVFAPPWMAAVDLRPPLADQVTAALDRPAPIIAHPDGRRVILTRCFHAQTVSEPGIGHRGWRTLIDLPPSRLWSGTLAWHSPPRRELPLCEPMLDLARRLRDQGR
jgi:hypothetical protein